MKQLRLGEKTNGNNRNKAAADNAANLVLASGIIGTRRNDTVQTVIMTLLFYNQFPNNSHSSNSRILLQFTKQNQFGLENGDDACELAHYGFIH